MTKRILVALAMFPVVAQAEISAGTFELSGDTTLTFSQGSVERTTGGFTDQVDTTDLQLSASGLFYVTPNVGVGLGVDYIDSTRESGGVKYGSSVLVIGPGLGLDFPVAPKLSLFALGTIGYASATYTETGTSSSTPTGWGLGLEGGIKFFPVSSVSLNAALGYNWVRLKEDPVEVTNSGIGLSLGVSVYLGGR